MKNIQTMLNGITDLYAGTGGSGSCYNGMPYAKLTTDGHWGPRTDTTVRAFQRWQCLSADGYVGPRTWSRLCGLAGQRTWRQDSSAYLRSAWNAAKASGCAVQY